LDIASEATNGDTPRVVATRTLNSKHINLLFIR